MGNSNYTPHHVRQAKLEGNTEALSAMGKKGAAEAKKTREYLALKRAEAREELERGMRENAEQRRDDLIPEDDR